MNKLSFKTTTLIAAIGMIIYTVDVVARYFIYRNCPLDLNYDLWDDVRVRLALDILPVSLIIVGIGLWNKRPSESVSKTFRYLTIGLFVCMVGTLLFSPAYSGQIGFPFLSPSIYWRALMLILGIIWLFMLRNQPFEEASSRSYRVSLVVGLGLLALPIILEAISCLSYVLSGYILLFNSYMFKPWVRWIAPVLVIVHFVFPQLKYINFTFNSHCTPGSFERRTFSHIRYITLVMVGLAALSMGVAYLSGPIFRGNYFFHYYVLQDQEWKLLPSFHLYQSFIQISPYIIGIPLLISWLMLSFMAFCQLPNPKGYKIFNVACQSFVMGTFIAVAVCFLPEVCYLSSWVVDFLAPMSIIVAIAFYITTTIRVISYSSLPHRRDFVHYTLKSGTPIERETSSEPSTSISEIITQNADKLAGIELKEGAIIPD